VLLQDGFIVVSFSNATLVFEIGEEVKETSSSGFLATVATLHTQLLEDGSMLQVHSGGLRHIRTDRRINEWRAPGRRAITRAATNNRQVVIALSGEAGRAQQPRAASVWLLMVPAARLLPTCCRQQQREASVALVVVGPERACDALHCWVVLHRSVATSVCCTRLMP
jgi:hypothetical protein